MPYLPEGSHNVFVTSAKVVQSAARNTPGIEINFKNDEGVAKYTGWITPNTQDRVIENLKVLGLTQDDIDNKDTLYNLDSKLNGAEANITVKIESYKGQEELKVAWINPVNIAGDDGAIERIYGLFTGRGPAPTAPRPPSSGPRPPRSAPLEDDSLDVPF